MVVGGDAGMGKTRLLAELLNRADAVGDLCLLGHCIDLGDAPPPYLPFTEALTRLAAEHPDLLAEVADAYPALTRLLPAHVLSAVPLTAPRVDPDERVDRGDLFAAVLGALGHLGRDRTVLLVVEDVHWADQATRDLLGYLFTRVSAERLLVVASWRSDDLHRRHPLRRVLSEWLRLPGVTHVQVERLGPDDVRALLRAEDTDGLSEHDLDGIVSRADGNAFFAEELLSAGAQLDGAQALPWQLADLLLVRLDRLSPDALDVVRVAAVGGRRVSHDMLAAVVGAPDQLDDALRESIDAHVLQLTSSGLGYVFRHALLAEAVYDDLLPGERVRLHARYAQVLSADAAKDSSELARHARAAHDLPTALAASVAAGDDALALAAPLEALNHYEVALELLPQLPGADVDPLLLTLSAVDAADAAGYFMRAGKLAEAALAELPSDAPPLTRARLLYARVTVAMSSEIGADVHVMATEALRLVPPEPPTEFLAQLLALTGRVALSMGREDEAERTLQRALEVADAVGSATAEADVQATLAGIRLRGTDPAVIAADLADVIAHARNAGSASLELRSWYRLGTAWLEVGDLSRAADAFAGGAARAREIGRSWELFGFQCRALHGTVQWFRGEWDTALAVVDTSGERPTGVARAVLDVVSLLVRGSRGDHAILDARDTLAPYWRRESRVPLYFGFGALDALAQLRDGAGARALHDELVGVLSDLWLNEWFLARIELAARTLAALAAEAGTAAGGRRRELARDARRIAADGRTTAERGLVPGRRMGPEGRAWQARLEAEAARVRWLTGDEPPSAQELVDVWREAVRAFDFGHLTQLTASRVRLAEVLAATGHRAEATEVAAAARVDAERLGAVPLVRDLDALVGGSARAPGATVGGAGPSGRDPWAALTDRERSVLTELVDGRTNRQIAAKLFISEKTVSVHVSNILAKLGVAGRGEAAAAARRWVGAPPGAR